MTVKPYHKTTHNDKQAYVLAIDLGGSGPKIALVSVRGEVIASTDEKIATMFLPGGAIKKVFHPNEDNREIYNRMYRGYRSFYKQNKSVFKTLNQQRSAISHRL